MTTVQSYSIVIQVVATCTAVGCGRCTSLVGILVAVGGAVRLQVCQLPLIEPLYELQRPAAVPAASASTVVSDPHAAQTFDKQGNCWSELCCASGCPAHQPRFVCVSPCTCDGGVHGDADDAGAREPREVCILELLPDCPGYKVALMHHHM